MKLYRHYKNKPYRYLGVARHSETLDEVVLYETLYPNDLGKLWVRPRKMFEEDIELGGRRQARFARIPLDIRSSEHILPTDWAELKICVDEKSWVDRPAPLLLKAYVEEKCVGFQIAFESVPGVLFSWLSAVDEEFRNLGIASDLLAQLFEYAKAKAYKVIHTEVSSESKEMLMFFLKNDFKITGTKNSAVVVLERKIV